MTMYWEWPTSPASQVVFSVRADRPEASRQELRRVSHAGVATVRTWSWTRAWSAAADSAEITPRKRRPNARTARRRLAASGLDKADNSSHNAADCSHLAGGWPALPAWRTGWDLNPRGPCGPTA